MPYLGHSTVAIVSQAIHHDCHAIRPIPFIPHFFVIFAVCRTGTAWQRINDAIRQSLDGVTLAQLCGQEAVALWRPELSGALRGPGARPGGRA
jgi:DNA-binding IscR family transcriptional regulator